MDEFESQAIDEATADAIEERHAPDRDVMAAPQPEPVIETVVFKETRSAPGFRIRINHSNTIKDGWRLAETTVECTFAGDEDPSAIGRQLSDWLDRSHVLGTIEARDRNTATEAVVIS